MLAVQLAPYRLPARPLALAALASFMVAAGAAAQGAAAQGATTRSAPDSVAPPLPPAPEPGGRPRPVERSAEGRLVMRALAAPAAVRVDGVLDDAVWQRAPRVTGFVQSEPHEGAPATESTEVMVAYDADYLYVAAILHDRDASRLVINDIKKDFVETDQDDFEVLLDTFDDRRNGYVFITNPAGARADRQTANEGRETNNSWDAVWTVKTRRGPDGWTAELAIPFRALRFESRDVATWGINFARRIRRKNEITYWSPVPRQYTITRVSAAGDLVGLRTAGATRDIRVKPYVAARTARELAPDARFASRPDAGVDVKLGLSRSLTLDATVNPDFAQAEADEQQVNLTQFSQFFPEKREFFLENSGLFYVGDAARNRPNLAPTPDEDLLLFFSRRIGLTAERRAIPISGGVRLTGHAAGMSVGALSMRTHDAVGRPGDAYGVLRLRRDLFAGSDVGLVLMERDAAGPDASGGQGARYNRVGGVDANLRFFGDWDWSSYAVRTATPGAARGQYAYRSTLTHEGTFTHMKGGVMELGEGFRDDLGYFRRTDVRKWMLDAGLRPRPRWASSHGVRELHPHVTWDYYQSLDGQTVGKKLHTGLSLFFNTGGFTELSVNPRFEYLASPFRIFKARGDSAVVPAGGWAWNEYMLKLQTDGSRALSLSVDAIAGGLWSGTQRTVKGTLTYRPSYRLRLAGGLSRTGASLAGRSLGTRDDFVATLVTARAGYSFTTNMFVDALTQYEPASRALDTNVRFNLIHHPLSDLFIVYNEQRIRLPGAPLPGRALIVKVTQMVAI